MTNLHKLLIIAFAAALMILAPQSSHAQGLSISIGDRPYYTHGASYWNNGVQWYWVPGHRYHGRWIKGHYAARGGVGVRVGPRHRIHRGYWGGW